MGPQLLFGTTFWISTSLFYFIYQNLLYIILFCFLGFLSYPIKIIGIPASKKKRTTGDVGDRTPDLPHAKRTLYHWATSPLSHNHFEYNCFPRIISSLSVNNVWSQKNQVRIKFPTKRRILQLQYSIGQLPRTRLLKSSSSIHPSKEPKYFRQQPVFYIILPGTFYCQLDFI